MLLGSSRLDEATFNHYLALKDELYRADIEDLTADGLLPGVLEFIRSAYQRDLKMGVASSSRSAELILTKTGIHVYMDAIGDGGTVSRSKPAPDIFIWVAGALRVRPAAAIVIEDSQAGIDAALTAGMFVVGIGKHAVVGDIPVRAASLQQLDLDRLIEQFKAARDRR